jgi:5-methylcytosine-specific restriction endonuclease McrA
MKTCTKCGKVKPETDFAKSSKGKNGSRAYCKACANQYMKRYYGQYARGRYHRLRDNAKYQGVLFDINPKDFVLWYSNQPKTCYYCGQVLTFGVHKIHKLTDLTFDRKVPSKGYTLENIVFACRRCNLMKGDWLTESQTLEIADKYFKPLR